MKKYIEIIEEIKNTYAKIDKLNEEEIAETARHNALMGNFDTLKEKVEWRKENAEECKKHDKKLTEIYLAEENEKIKIKILANNAKIALFNEVMPVVLEILSKYNGKPYGKKTEEKILNEVKEKTKCSFYISDRYGDWQEINVLPLDNYRNYDFVCAPKFENGNRKQILINNKIQAVTMEDLELCYINRNYFENVDEVVENMRRLRTEAKEKLAELKEIEKAYNFYTVEGLKDLYTREENYNYIF